MRTSRLYRFPKQGYLGGVCSGLEKHTGLDARVWRIITIFGGFCFIYLILWVILKKGE